MENKFTFENNSQAALETYEWDNVWWEQTGDLTTKRVLYIGDSISCATRHHATALSNGALLFDGFGTSKALDNPYFKESLLTFAKQQPKREMIVINNGLHGFHLNDQQYKDLYRDMIVFLKESFPNTPIALVLTTFVGDDKVLATVKNRNNCVKELAEELELDIIDFYSVSEENSNLLAADKIHFTEAGYDILGKYLSDMVNELLK